MILALPPYGSSCTCTRSPTSTLILCRRIFPARYESTISPLSSFTRNSVFGSASSTVPSTTSASAISACERLAIRRRYVKFWAQPGYFEAAGSAILIRIRVASPGNVLDQNGSIRAVADCIPGNPVTMVWKALWSRPASACASESSRSCSPSEASPGQRDPSAHHGSSRAVGHRRFRPRGLSLFGFLGQ